METAIDCEPCEIAAATFRILAAVAASVLVPSVLVCLQTEMSLPMFVFAAGFAGFWSCMLALPLFAFMAFGGWVNPVSAALGGFLVGLVGTGLFWWMAGGLVVEQRFPFYAVGQPVWSGVQGIAGGIAFWAAMRCQGLVEEGRLVPSAHRPFAIVLGMAALVCSGIIGNWVLRGVF